MDLIIAIKNRRSIRKYKNREVPMEILLKLIEAASWAPSSKNRQPWEFIITTDKNKIRAIARIKGEDWIMSSPAIILALSNPKISPIYHMSDTAMAMHNISLAALEYDLGTCWIGIYENEEVKKIFGIPRDIILVGALAVGYPDEQPRKRKRKNIEEILHLETYGKKIHA